MVKDELGELCEEFSETFIIKRYLLSTKNLYKQIKMADNNPGYVHTYRLSHTQNTKLEANKKDMLDNEIIDPTTAEYQSALLLVPKKPKDGRKQG